VVNRFPLVIKTLVILLAVLWGCYYVALVYYLFVVAK
jgi:hypothetical protein